MSQLSVLNVFLFVFLVAQTMMSDHCFGMRSRVLCLEAERQALLRFKQDLVDPSSSLSTWVEEEDNGECCEWAGITCDNVTGHVTEISLNHASLAGKINPSLLDLKHLSYLDLGFNSFRGVRIPSFLGSLANLTYLDLSYAGFEGMVPSQLGNLSHLQHLDIYSGNEESLYVKSLDWISGLSSLEYLDMTQVNLKEASDRWVFAMNALPSLVRLYLPNCELHSPTSFPSPLNLTSIEDLDLSANALAIPHLDGLLRNMSRLRFLNLSSNNGFSSNSFSSSSPILVSLGSLSKLEWLYISSNHLQGVVSEVHFVNLTNLIRFLASGNSLSMRVAPNWIPPFHLDFLELSSWKLGPTFPSWLKSQKGILGLDLSNTGISGVIPSWFWNLSDVFTELDLSRNQLSGGIPDLRSFHGLVNMHSNKLTGSLPRISYPLEWLDLSNNSFSGHISDFVCNPDQKNNTLFILKLRNNMLQGNIPDCWSNWSSLELIDLGSNNLSGEIPTSIGMLNDLESLHLRNNSLTGEIPESLGNCSRLNILDLGLNKFDGSVPTWIGSLPLLSVLVLRSNNLKGRVPVEFCALVELQILDVADNKIDGTIPKCFKNVFSMISNNSEDSSSGFLYVGFDDQVYMDEEILMTKGRENRYDNILSLVTTLDLSSNNLSGEIPEELAWLQKLQHLNLSRNHFNGGIPHKIGNMTKLESLDLSHNQLTGEIPPSMSILTFLDYLDLSDNNLSGEIPKSTQLQSLDPSSFAGNRLLCGDPLPKRCRGDDHTTPQAISKNEETEDDDDDDGEDHWFNLGIVMGFGVGFFGIIAPLALCGFWRRAYFWFIQEYIWYNILDGFIKFKHVVGITTPLHRA